MKIQEACRLAGVTRKAALVAAEQGLLAPARLENGYRDFSSEDVTRLRKIAVLRGLGMTGEAIREYFAGDQAALSRAAMAGHLRQEREAVRQRALEELARTGDWEAARAALEALQAQESLAERLLDAFPGFFGQYMALHFSAFLQEPIREEAQRAAFEEAVGYLDSVSLPELSPQAKEFLAQASGWYTPAVWEQVHAATLSAAKDPQGYMEAHAQEMEAWQQAKAAIPADHPLREIRQSLAALTSSPGYQQIFLPALRRMSPAYDRYVRQLQQADAAFTPPHTP